MAHRSSRGMSYDDGPEVVASPSGEGLEVADLYAGYGLESVRHMNGDKDGSALEVAQKESIESNNQTRLIGLEMNQTDNYAGSFHPPRQQKRRRSRRMWWIIGAIVLLLVIIIAVLGGVLGSRVHSGSSSGSDPSSPPAGSPTTITPNTGLASIAWSDPNNVVHYRVYYQDEGLAIRESAWNNSQQIWYVSNLGFGLAMNGTPIAAAVNGTSTGVSISLFYVGSLGYINEWTSTDGLNWQKGLLDSHSVIPAKTSSLAATYALNYGLANPNVCQSCSPASLLFVYEDTKNNFQLCNRTGATDWTFSAIPTNPIAGSGVGLVAIKEDQYPYQLRLFYQTKTGNALVAADWVSGDQISGSGLSNASVGWNLNEKTALTQFDHGAMVSSFCFGLSGDDVQSYGAVSGLPYLVDVLTSGSTGVTAVAWFPNGDATYSTPYKPSVMDTVQNYSSIASHAWGSLYAMENGYLTEFVTAGDNNWNTKGQVITS